MDPISSADRLKALLRQRLKERAGAAAHSRGSGPPDAAPIGMDAIAMAETTDQLQLRRACVQALLVDAFGRGVLNDAGFQQVVTRVTATLSSDPRTLQMLDQVVTDAGPTRGGARR